MTETEKKARRPYEIHARMLEILFWSTFVICGTACVLIIVQLTRNGTVSTFLCVAFAGALGGFTSGLRRGSGVPDTTLPEAYWEVLSMQSGRIFISSMVPPLIGVLSAAMALLLFASNLVQGDLFPVFKCLPDDKACDTLGNTIRHISPAAGKDYIKCLAWGFIAGFSEQFVPGLIGNLTKAK